MPDSNETEVQPDFWNFKAADGKTYPVPESDRVDKAQWADAIATTLAGDTVASPANDDPVCKRIMLLARMYYDNADTIPKLKAYEVPPGENAGLIAENIPRQGDIAACNKR